ncbi:MAG: hypothetical protein JWL58_1586 [Streptosporangiaceae bacterium]|nr:hypothetical protein [Streptosporangiaceae bacterium]
MRPPGWCRWRPEREQRCRPIPCSTASPVADVADSPGAAELSGDLLLAPLIGAEGPHVNTSGSDSRVGGTDRRYRTHGDDHIRGLASTVRNWGTGRCPTPSALTPTRRSRTPSPRSRPASTGSTSLWIRAPPTQTAPTSPQGPVLLSSPTPERPDAGEHRP